MEELIYWGIIFLFYLFSAYRSRQKKVETEDIQAPEIPIQSEPQKPKADFNIFEFLDDTMEKSALELDDAVDMNLVQPPTTDSSQSESNTRPITPDYDLNSITSSVDNESYDIKDKHHTHRGLRTETRLTVYRPSYIIRGGCGASFVFSKLGLFCGSDYSK